MYKDNDNFSSPEFDDTKFTPENLLNHIEEIIKKDDPVPHAEILIHLLDKIFEVDFRKLSEIPDGEKPKNNHYQIITVEHVLNLAKQNKWGICRNHDFIYLFNGAYWSLLEVEELKKFFGEAAEKMSVDKFKARHYHFREQLFRQFIALANLPMPEEQKDQVLVNLKNGTFEITSKGTRLRPFNKEDFITYQLQFDYDTEAKAPIFEGYLNRILPDKQRQQILSEYLGYVFIRPKTLKLEKTLLLYGTGANGKSVFFEIVNALLGEDNVSSYSLQSLTNENGYYRAKLANKLVNYGSEISGNLETAFFKLLVSGEPIEARLPYGEPFTLTQYAKLIFNCNELPKDVEHTIAYFRRFIIIPFDVAIPEVEQDPRLAQKIIANELSGVFNWVLQGLHTLLDQKHFTDCEAVNYAREQYEKQSDSVKLFIEESGYKGDPSDHKLIKDLYLEYRTFCSDDGYKPVGKSNFMKRLQNAGVVIEKKNKGNVAFVTKLVQSA